MSEDERLAVRTLGDAGPWVVFVHGLFGLGKNWTTIAKGLTDRTGEFKFTNLRAAAWWRMRELLDPSQPGGSDIMLPDSEVLKADLTSPHWKVLSGGSIQVESKDEIRKRLGRSTDEGDAVVMSFWQGRGRVDSVQHGAVSWWDEPVGESVVSWGIEEMVASNYGE